MNIFVLPEHAGWIDDADYHFENLNPYSKITMVLKQAILVKYVSLVYHGALPKTFKSCVDHINTSLFPIIEHERNASASSDERSHFTQALNICRYLLGHTNRVYSFDSELEFNWMTSIANSSGNAASFYKSFTKFLECMYYKDAKGATKSFSVDDVVIPTFINDKQLCVTFDMELDQFSFSCDKFVKFYRMDSDLIYIYWRAAARTIDKAMGILIQAAVEKDVELLNNSSMLKTYAHIARAFFPSSEKLRYNSNPTDACWSRIAHFVEMYGKLNNHDIDIIKPIRAMLSLEADKDRASNIGIEAAASTQTTAGLIDSNTKDREDESDGASEDPSLASRREQQHTLDKFSEMIAMPGPVVRLQTQETTQRDIEIRKQISQFIVSQKNLPGYVQQALDTIRTHWLHILSPRFLIYKIKQILAEGL